MTLRDDLIGVVDAARSVVDDLGLRPRVVTIVTRTWSGSQVGSGSATSSTLTIDPAPVVSDDPEARVAGTGGTEADGRRTVRKISASYTRAQLEGTSLTASQELFWTIDGELYSLDGPAEKRSFEWVVRLRRMSR